MSEHKNTKPITDGFPRYITSKISFKHTPHTQTCTELYKNHLTQTKIDTRTTGQFQIYDFSKLTN